MLYITMADLEGRIPLKFLVEALDDDDDGQVDPTALNTVLQTACDTVNGILGARYPVPFQNPLPAVIVDAARIFACELIYQRRGKSADENPFTKQANQLRDPETGSLTKIAAGEQPLTPAVQRAQPSGVVLSAKAKTVSSTGKMAV